MSDWLRLKINLRTSKALPLIQKLHALGASGIQIHDQETFEPEPEIEPRENPQPDITAFFEYSSAKSLEELRSDIHDELENSDAMKSLKLEPYNPRDWSEAWKEYFHAEQLAPRFWVAPPWEEPSIGTGQHLLTIDPGMAFGTGTHETTQMCAEQIDRFFTSADCVDFLDVGCGSGILTMIARKCGADACVGIDHDSRAIEIARENAQANETEDIEFSTTPIEELERHFDLVVANMLTPILIDLSDAIISRLSSGGILLLSGIKIDQKERVLETYLQSNELEAVESLRDAEWITLKLEAR